MTIMTTLLQRYDFEALNAEYENAAPQDILRWGVREFGQDLAVVTSFQPSGIVAIQMLSEIAPQTPILTLDTGILFAETYALMDALEARFDLNLKRIKPALTLAQQATQYGDALWERDSDACCNMRKVVPLGEALAPYQAWVTGLRRDQHGREKTPVISWDKKYNKVKLCPFATWTEDMLWLYIESYELPYNALHDQGYPSIGCNTAVCTQPTQEGNERSGRWVNSRKSECGIHVAN
jgi:phosphoadenosine phosphosulfate reductase